MSAGEPLPLQFLPHEQGNTKARPPSKRSARGGIPDRRRGSPRFHELSSPHLAIESVIRWVGWPSADRPSSDSSNRNGRDVGRVRPAIRGTERLAIKADGFDHCINWRPLGKTQGFHGPPSQTCQDGLATAVEAQ